MSDPTGTAVVVLVGDVDVSNVDSVRSEVDRAIAGGCSSVIFDLSAVSFLDSSALALFAQTTLRVPQVTLRGASALIQRVIASTGLDDVLGAES